MNIEFASSPDVASENLIKVWKDQVLAKPFSKKFFANLEDQKGRDSFFQWFEGLELDKQEQIVRSSLGAASDVEPGEISIADEVKYVGQFLFRYGMRLVDQDAFTKITPDDFIEIYDTRGIQIYRSWNFFQFCRYTIDEVLTKSWGELYERPEFVQQKLMKLFPIFFETEKSMDYNIEEFILTERYLNPSAKYLVRMKFASPVRDMKTDQTVAFLSVAQAKKLDN